MSAAQLRELVTVNAICVGILYAPRKHVRKPKGAPPGSVRVLREEVLLVEPRATIIESVQDGPAGHTVIDLTPVYAFALEKARRGVALRADGSVDFRDASRLKDVTRGQELARYHPATLGSDGLDVRGRPIEARPGRDLDLSTFCGAGTRIAEHDARLLVATGIGAAAFAMQDVLLEPYGGEILGLSVSATTLLTATWAGGALAGVGLVLAERRRLPDLEGLAATDEHRLFVDAGKLGHLFGQHDTPLAVEGQLHRVRKDRGRHEVVVLGERIGTVMAIAEFQHLLPTPALECGVTVGAVDDDAMELLSGQSLALTCLVKALAFTAAVFWPLPAIAFFGALAYGLEPGPALVTAFALLLAAPGLALVASFAGALAAGLKRAGLLIALIAAPLQVPLLIFAAGAARSAVEQPDLVAPNLMMTAAYSLAALALAPLGAAAALRARLE